MPEFVYTDVETRYFHYFGDLSKGDRVTADVNPDPLRFAPAKASKSAQAATTTETE